MLIDTVGLRHLYAALDAGKLAAVHGRVDALQYAVEIIAVHGDSSYAYRDTQRNTRVLGPRGYRRLQAVCDLGGGVQGAIGQYQHKLIAAKARGDI